MENFKLFLSSGESLIKSIVDYSRGEQEDRRTFYLKKYITEKRDQAVFEYYKIDYEENKNSTDDTGIVVTGNTFKCTVIKTDNEDCPYKIMEQRFLNVGGTDLCQLPASEQFPGQYSITFLSLDEWRDDVRKLKNELEF
jgi:hypothetical protein